MALTRLTDANYLWIAPPEKTSNMVHDGNMVEHKCKAAWEFDEKKGPRGAGVWVTPQWFETKWVAQKGLCKHCKCQLIRDMINAGTRG